MPVAANNLAWMYAETGENLDMALQLAQAAARRLPNIPAIQDTLGWIHHKKGLGEPGQLRPFKRASNWSQNIECSTTIWAWLISRMATP